ncbi:MAG: hypothetical protein A2219_08435 [Elusimicrobia bacterium RIFOXYA2_FULL_50_26]|nr:MAG: hypothetical protein A2219_08435 [Elusimicrobia bacterium RIFOXYA2_FULL_50_26]
MRRQMEAQVIELQKQLQEEREKLLLQTVRAKEEEAMASKVEESLKDIQDRLRREKREQELQEQLLKADARLKEMEQRLGAERQTWVETLRTQLSQREGQEKELESHFEIKLKELERRWHEEKLGWAQAAQAKDTEVARLRREFESALMQEREGAEKAVSYSESERESLKRELANLKEMRDEERSNLITKLEARDKEYLGLKAQQAMIVTQLRHEKDKMEQLRHLLEKMRGEKSAMGSQLEAREKDFFVLKTQFALYQTRAKTEQEKLLKEMSLFKEQSQKDERQAQSREKAKDDEIELVSRAAQTREADLIAQIDKKETELRAQKDQYEERMKSRERELTGLVERKEAEYRFAIGRLEDTVRSREEEHARRISQKENEVGDIRRLFEEKLAAKDKEISVSMEKEREHSVNAVRLEQRVRELEEKLSARAQELVIERERAAQREVAMAANLQQKENELKNVQAQQAGRIAEKDREIAAGREKELKLEDTLGRQQERLKEISAGHEAQQLAWAQEKEQFSRNENSLKLAFEQKDKDAQRIQAQLNERLESKDREISMHVERQQAVAKTADELRTRLNEFELKQAGLAQELAREREQLIRKESEIKNGEARAAALSQEKESIIAAQAALRRQIEERDRAIAEVRDAASRLGQELASERARLADRENIYAAKELQSQERLQARDHEIAALHEKENESRNGLAEYERKIKSLEDGVSLIGRERDREKEALIGKDRDIIALKEQFERERQDMKSRMSLAGDELRQVVSAKDNEIKAMAQKYEDERRILESRNQAALDEIRRLAEERSAAGREVERVKSENLLREKDISIEYQRKEAGYKDVAAQMNARLQELEKTLRNQQQEADLRLQQKETQWLSRIQSLDAELSASVERQSELKKAHAEVLAQKEEIGANAKRYEEKILSEFAHEKKRLENEMEQRHRQEMERLAVETEQKRRQEAERVAGDMEKKHKQEMERLAVETEQRRKHEAGELEKKYTQQTERLAVEMEQKRKQEAERVAGELENRHRQEMERLSAERDAFTAALSGELQSLRSSMRTDLISFGEQYANEQSQIKAALQDKERALATMAGQAQELGAHSRKQVEDMRQHAELLAKDNEILSARCAELEKEIVARQQRETEQLRSAVGRMEDINCDDSSVIQFPETPSGENNGMLGRFWKNLHSPVVEIDFKNRKSHGGKY